MAELLKDVYNVSLLKKLGSFIRQEAPSFPLIRWQKNVLSEPWADLSLKQRMDKIAVELANALGPDFAQNLTILTPVAPQITGLPGLLFPHFVERFADRQHHRKIALKALLHFTSYSSSEFAVRPFILDDPQAMAQTMKEWSLSSNYHIRRLASEGCRPRLPWGQALPVFIQDPSPILPILENLNADPELYVRKSVANNLNDISKDHPEWVVKNARNWLKRSPVPETQWIVRHGLRTLIKQGDPGALSLLGYSERASWRLTHHTLKPKKLRMGEHLHFQLSIQNPGKKPLPVLVDYKIYHQKKNGELTPKVFKLSQKVIGPGETLKLEKRHSFKPISTRRYHRGEHQISLLINGRETPALGFYLEV